ncbi:hypothetical protein STEG23_003212, partial [Scotinomys teguina]
SESDLSWEEGRAVHRNTHRCRPGGEAGGLSGAFLSLPSCTTIQSLPSSMQK